KAGSLLTMGLAPSPDGLAQVLAGAVVAACSVAVVLAVGLGSDVFAWDTRKTVVTIASDSATTFIGAALLAMSEEFFFRGCLLGWLRQRVHSVAALTVVALFYAICRFVYGGGHSALDRTNGLRG